MPKTEFREIQCKPEMILWYAAAAGTDPVDSDVSTWPATSAGLVHTTDGKVFFARKNPTDIFFVELTAI